MINELSARFLEVLKYLIESNEVSDNKDFASRISVSTSMITEISKGRSNVGLSAIQNTVLEFPINSDWLLTGEGSMIRDKKSFEEYKPMRTSISESEESIIYKMFEKEKAENRILIEEIGGLKERIRNLETELKECQTTLESSIENPMDLSNAKNVSIKKHSSQLNPNVTSAIAPSKDL